MALRVDYVARETLSNLRRNLLLSTASMLTVAVSLSMVGVAFLLRDGVDNATARWKNGVEFEVFLNLDASPEQKGLIEQRLKDSPEVSRVTFVDREKQYRLFRTYFADQPEYLQNVQAKDLPESYRVRPSIENAAEIKAVGARFEQQPGVKQVEFAADQVNRAFRTSRALQIGMFVIALVLSFASSLLIFNTIRTAIFSRRREIEVMKLVGATNWFIRVPFMVEGLAQGIVGAVASFSVIYALKHPLKVWIVSNFDQFVGFVVLSHQVLVIGLLMMVVGAFIGAISAGVAVTRFLDV
ncbi:MAG: ABC transporter permease [Acidobacteria bacterium]|nr:ABC transporter permease [Acidobacteriota bacterium]